MTWLFIILAVISFVGFGMQARRYNGYGMAYSAALVFVWVIAALWSTGRLG